MIHNACLLTHRWLGMPDKYYLTQQIFVCLLCADTILGFGDKAVNKRHKSIPWPPGASVLVRKDDQSITILKAGKYVVYQMMKSAFCGERWIRVEWSVSGGGGDLFYRGRSLQVSLIRRL